MPNEFRIFTVHCIYQWRGFFCCIKTNHLVLTLSNSSDINSDKVKGNSQSRIIVGVHRERGMLALLRLLISWLRLTCVCTSNKVSNLFPVKKCYNVNWVPVISKTTSCPGKECQPPSWVNFRKHLYEKKVDPSGCANSALACSDCLRQYSHMLWLFHPGRGGTLHMKRVGMLVGNFELNS